MKTIEKHCMEVVAGMNLLEMEDIEKAVEIFLTVRKNHGTVYVFGNGGSSSTASHFANDLMKSCRIKSVAIGDMVPAVTAWGNDTGWENMFFGPLSELVRWNDCLVGISCSGNSANVVRAMQAGKDEWEVPCVGLTGISTGSMLDALDLDVLIHTPGVVDIRVQEDLHLMICHAMVREIRERK